MDTAVVCKHDGSSLTLNLPSGIARFHAIWLRDNSLHPACRSASNGQRLDTLLEYPADLRIVSAWQLPDGTLQVRFEAETIDHDFPLSWLEAHRYDRVQERPPGWTNAQVQCWGAELQGAVPTASFAAVSTDPQALHDWLADVRRLGFARLTDLPDYPEALLQVTALFGYVRETNYGRYFEVRSEVNPVNLAYTNQGLQAHTDNPYRDPVPTLQILACLENSTAGGESIVVDGFQVVRQLQQENPQHFELLSRYCARFQYTGSSGVCLYSKRPLIELNPDGELIAVRFNNRSAAPFIDIPFAQMPAFYQAYRHFAELIEQPSNRVSFKLRPQELFIVDNTRVLHARTAFSGSGTRWLRGCYPDKDGLLSTLASLEAQLQQAGARP